MEDQIDIDLQMEYFEFAGNLKENLDILSEEIMIGIPSLFLEETSIHDKKKSLILLATLDNPEAYRAIEKYIVSSDGEMLSWAKMALHESRMLLHSSFLGENQVFISTGLGGKGVNLRYCVILISKDKKGYNSTQQKVIKNEFSIHLSQVKGVSETIDFDGSNAIIMCLIPITVPVRDFFLKILKECNGFGNFIKSDFIVTNVKKLQSKDVTAFLKKNRQQETSIPFDDVVDNDDNDF